MEPSLHIRFQALLDGLNVAQSEAVETIEGPVQVIAGPGTGKTHILTARIGRILMETDTQPHNILCLTFTEAGAIAMRERLLSFIGPEAHKVHIHTFHSFCNKIIQDNLEYFGRHNLEPLSDLDRVEIIRRLIDQLPATHPLKRGHDAYFYEQHLYDLFKLMKTEDWTVEHVHRCIAAYLNSLPERPEFIYKQTRGTYKKGELKQHKLDEEHDRMARLHAAAALFPDFERALHRARSYDFDDMILWVIRAFRSNTHLLRNYQEQYLYFLVDEFQDTNGAQYHVLQQLIEYWPSPNVFIVGDDDQSIFEFQGARLKNLVDFYQKYTPELKLIVLTDNYRSSQSILDSAGALIANNQQRIIHELADQGVVKRLKASKPGADSNAPPPVIRQYQNRLHEEADIVEQISQLHAANFPLPEVAIICAKHRQYENIRTLLEKRGIPYHTRRRINILDLPLILNLRTLLEYLSLEFHRPYSGEHLLFRVMHFDFLGLPAADLARLSLWQSGKEQPWRQAISHAGALREAGVDAEPFLRLAALIESLIGDLVNLPLPALLERAINRSGLLAYIDSQADRIWWIQVLGTFFDFVKGETLKNQRLHLRRLLEMLGRMDDNQLTIEINKGDFSENGVNLLTAHSAKGLEFEYVFIPDAVKDQWEPGSKGNPHRFPLPDTLTFSGEEDALEARRRLFYVAMTRAKSRLYLSYSEKDHHGKPLQRAIFTDEVSAAGTAAFEQREVPAEIWNQAQYQLLLEAEPVRIQPFDKMAIDALLENFKLSVSALNRFLRCPLSFFYENVLKIPGVSSEAAAYGTSAHYALQMVFKKMLSHKKLEFPSESQFIGYFEAEMRRQQGSFSQTEYERRLGIGRKHLQQYYERHVAHWHKNVKVEFNVSNVEVDGVPLTGIIDKIEILDISAAHVVDYKTGSHESGKLNRPSEKNPYGGVYWRQLVFYKILFEHYQNNPYRVRTGSIAFLDPDSRGHFPFKTIDIEAGDVELLRSWISQTWEKIRNHDFYEGCGKPDCTWCQFVKRIQPLSEDRNWQEETLDDN